MQDKYKRVYKHSKVKTHVILSSTQWQIYLQSITAAGNQTEQAANCVYFLFQTHAASILSAISLFCRSVTSETNTINIGLTTHSVTARYTRLFTVRLVTNLFIYQVSTIFNVRYKTFFDVL